MFTRTDQQRKPCAHSVIVLIVMCGFFAFAADARSGGPTPNANHPGILEPSLTATTGVEVRIPNTDQADGNTLLNLVGAVDARDAEGELSLAGHTITRVESPNDDMRQALGDLSDSADAADQAGMTAGAQDLMDILLGDTQGRIYDGFAMLNFNRGAFAPGHLPDEYKMKTLTDTGLTAPGMDGVPRKIWEVTVNYLWYDGQFDSDSFLLRVPLEAHQFDTLRIHYRIYSLVREELAPTTVLLDNRLPGSVQFPFKGFDSVWVPINGGTLTEITVEHPPLRLMRGVYVWGWRVHPPRIQFLQPVFEMVNAHSGLVELEPQGMSFAFRNRQLSIDDIGDAAPEKKMYNVAQAVLGGATPADVAAMLNESNTGPRGTWQEWADLAQNQQQLPAEAWDELADAGIPQGEFGDYRFVTVYMNNELYGEGPEGNSIRGWFQGDTFQVKLINLDNHTHYFRNVDFGTRLNDDIETGFGAGSHSFEIMNFKPTYGAPKVAEVQWRAGWGFRPHFDVIHQPDLFRRPSDKERLALFFDGAGRAHPGWQYSPEARGGDFRFNPPPFIIGSVDEPSAQRLSESDGTEGLLIGRLTEGYGTAKMCSADDHPLGGFCMNDISAFNPHGVKNIDIDGDETADVLRFPPFLRNPNPDAGGDIIPPTQAWKPFLWINPDNGTLFIDPADPSLGYWADLTYSHGTPISAGGELDATIEAPRASAQLFYQFDDLFHDNAIFSPHPTFAPSGGDCAGNGTVNLSDFAIFATCFGLTAPNAVCNVDDFGCSDLNADGVINLVDFSTFALNFSG